MAVISGPSGFGINLPVNIDFSNAKQQLKDYVAQLQRESVKLRAEVDARPSFGRPGLAAVGPNSRVLQIKQGQQAALLAGMQVFVNTKRWPSGLQQGVFVPWKKPPKANASPGAQPQTFLSKSVGAMNSAIGGWRQIQQGQVPTKLGVWFGYLTSGGKKPGKNYAPIPGYSDFVTNRTANTSYLGTVAGGLFSNIERFSAITTAAQKTGDLGGLRSGVVLATVIYKGAELTARVGATGKAWQMKSGEAAAKSPAGRFFNEAASTFDYINNYGTAVNDSFKMTADFDDIVASVTGKLPDVQMYRPRFFRIAQANLQFEAMVKRNLATTRAGAMGNSDVADQIAHSFLSAAAQR